MPSSKSVPDSVDYLTEGELLFLTRHRNRMSLRRWTERQGINLKKYIQSERNQTRSRLLLSDWIAYQRCVIYRRRSKMTQDQVAKELGVSRGWVNSMERGRAPCETLVWYWEA